jgi:hypothetical protein
MYDNETRGKLQNIISGTIIEGQTDNCTAARNHLCKSFSTSTNVKRNFERQSKIKEEQAESLIGFAVANKLLFYELPNGLKYLAQGGEAKIYLDIDNRNVIKVNDAIYYATWLDFLNSLLIHNLLFDKTAYTLIGFINENDCLKAIVKQVYITADSKVNLDAVKDLLNYNGFENTKNCDYYNKEFSLILEDIHDENVITQNNTLFFIDTVFYINIVG